jgi:hypothetical protein
VLQEGKGGLCQHEMVVQADPAHPESEPLDDGDEDQDEVPVLERVA